MCSFFNAYHNYLLLDSLPGIEVMLEGQNVLNIWWILLPCSILVLSSKLSVLKFHWLCTSYIMYSWSLEIVRSFIYIKNNAVPSMEPWDAIYIVDFNMLCKSLWNNCNGGPFMPIFFLSLIGVVGSTIPKAFQKSNTYALVSNLHKQS